MTFAALADPTRRAMPARLLKHPDLTVGELAQPFPIKLPAIVKHLDVLSERGAADPNASRAHGPVPAEAGETAAGGALARAHDLGLVELTGQPRGGAGPTRPSIGMHEGLPDREQVDSHRDGWSEALDKLERVFPDRPSENPPMSELKPATELAAKASKPYPNESDEYRRARTALLAEEIELRRQIQRVAAQRRALPPGGEAAGLSLPRRGRARKSASSTCSASTTRSSPISGCTARSASGPARCAPRSSARSTSRRPTSSSASRSRSSAARRSRASSPSPASAAGAT